MSLPIVKLREAPSEAGDPSHVEEGTEGTKAEAPAQKLMTGQESTGSRKPHDGVNPYLGTNEAQKVF